VNKITEKVKNVLLIISQRETYFKSNQAPPTISIFIFATVMEGTEYFAVGLCFHLYLLPKWTKEFDVTVQLPSMTKTTVNSLKKKPYEQNTAS